MRIAVIGSSHVAALQHGWDEEARARWPGVEPVFFGSLVYALRGTRREGRLLLPGDPDTGRIWGHTSGSAEVVDTAQFDGFWLHGLDDWADLVARAAGMAQHAAAHRFRPSAALLDAAAREWLGATMWTHVAVLLREATAAPVWATSRPLWGEGIREGVEPGEYYAGLLGHAGHPLARDLVAAAHGAAEGFARRTGQVRLVQPAATVVDGCLTRREFYAGAKALGGDGDVPPGDFLHMNAAYGRAVLDEVLGRATGARAGPAVVSGAVERSGGTAGDPA